MEPTTATLPTPLTARERGLKHLLSDIALFSLHVVGTPLRPYQLESARAILDSVLHRQGRTFTVMMSRQAGKNELSAQLEAFLLNLYQRRGGSIIKAAPTFRPQIVNSMLRLERALDNDLNRGRWSRQQSSIIQLGRARAFFFSGEPESHVVGATASLLLEIDEAQDFDEEKYLKDFRPMGATTNVTTVLYGTAWTADTLLERARRENLRLEAEDGGRRDFRYPWMVVAQHNPDYRAYVEAEMARMGPDHPLIRTQYLLDPLERSGHFLSETQLAQLQGEHARCPYPPTPTRHQGARPPETPGTGGIRPHPHPLPEGEGELPHASRLMPADLLTPHASRLMPPELLTPHASRLMPPEPAQHSALSTQHFVYVAGIDVAGEDEEAEDAALRRLKPRKDSTAVTICAVTWGVGDWGLGAPNPQPPTPSSQLLTREPSLRVVQHYWWTGRKHRELFPTLVDLLKQVWHCRAVVVDATGVGAGVASFLAGALPGVARPFVFTAASKSALGYGLLAAINGGRLKLYVDDGSPESVEVWHEARLARSTLHENQRLSFYVDPREGHDDLLMSLALAVEAAAGAEPRIALGRARSED